MGNERLKTQVAQMYLYTDVSGFLAHVLETCHWSHRQFRDISKRAIENTSNTVRVERYGLGGPRFTKRKDDELQL